MRRAFPLLIRGLSATVAILPVGLVGQLQSPGAPQVPALFSSHEVIEFTLETDYGALRGDRTPESEYRPAILRVTDLEGESRTTDVRVRTRGNFRLQNCRFPPLRINFSGGSTGGTVFDGQGGIKLVSHCRDRDDDEQDVIEEYLVYRTFNLLTDESFRVRLARITYVDAAGGTDPTVRYAFFVEEAEAMAARLGAQFLEVGQTRPSTFGAEEAVRVSVFEYMVGNTDWSMVAFHNVEVMLNSEGIYVPVPYDFDWSGFVSAPYARPDPRLGIRNVRQRVYRGFCRPNFDISSIYAQFVRLRGDLEALYTGQGELEDTNQKKAIEYVAGFYADISTGERARDRLEKSCRRM